MASLLGSRGAAGMLASHWRPWEMAVAANVALADYDRTAALADGRVQVPSLPIEVVNLAPSEIFYRMLSEEEFDICEMSLSSYLISRAQGRRFTAIPVFPHRHLFHLDVLVREDIDHPQQLSGRRFGLTEYQVTAALWTRGVLAEDFGLDLRTVTWYVERSPQLSHGGETGFEAPPGITILQIPEGETLVSLMEAGELDAVLPSPYPGMPSRLNRTEAGDVARLPGISRLFRDPLAEGRRFYSQHGFLHFNHVIVVKDDLLERIPALATELLGAFEEAKRLAFLSRERLRRSSLLFAHLHLEVQDALYGADPYPYGFAANVDPLRKLAGFSKSQGLIDDVPDLASLFAKDVRDT